MKRLLLLLALTGSVLAQGVRYDSSVTTSATNVPPGMQAQVLTVPNALVSVCFYPATGGQPCTNYAPIFANAGLTTPIVQPLQADAQGRFGFFVAAGLYAVSYQKPSSAFIGTFAVNVPSPNGIVGGVVYADQQPGATLANKVANGFTASPTGAVYLNAGSSYSFSDSLVLPFNAGGPPVLDCQGATLNYTGTGYALNISAGITAPYRSGFVRNCNFVGTASAAGAIHQMSRVGMTLENVTFSNFTSGESVLLDNVAFPGVTGSGWNEQFSFRGAFYNDKYGIRTKTLDGGTNSYAYSDINIEHCQFSDGQWCLSVEGNGSGSIQTADMYGGHLKIKANGSIATALSGGAVRVINGGALRGADGDMALESSGSGYAVYVDPNNSQVDVCGHVFNSGQAIMNAGSSDSLQWSTTAPACGGNKLTVQAPPFNHGVEQANNSKIAFDGNTLSNFTPVLGQYPSGGDFLYWRFTTDVPHDGSYAANRQKAEADYAGDVSAPLHTIRACSGPNLFTGELAGCSFGQVSGPGTSYPRVASIETDTLSVSNRALGTTADKGVTFTTAIDGVGNILTSLVSGKPSPLGAGHWKFSARDYGTSTNPVIWDCYALNGASCMFGVITTGSAANTDLGGFLTLSGGTATYSFTESYLTAPICVATDTSAVAAIRVSTTTTALTVQGTASDVASYICIGRTRN